MLKHTFIHLPSIGPRRERWLWERGCLDWDRFLAAADARELARGTYNSVLPLVRQSATALAMGDTAFFGARLPTREAWRLYPNFADQALFLDIETTGLSAQYDDVTMIGAWGGGQLKLFVHGMNLEQFPAYVARFPLLVTFNGSQFDVPFLRARFPQARLDQAHVDLRFTLASLGYRGGLKAVERMLGLARNAEIQMVDGFEAVRLWHRYRQGHRAALRKLALYCVTDVVNLIELAQIAVSQKIQQLGFPGLLNVPTGERTGPVGPADLADALDACLAGA
ncbi:MAG: ribonuclease H-like domain-containing protein [Pirellulaceae bacterium]|nr:ribonuclease H-like domain-containing protein [Pirellulaceae bacterium]